MKKIIDPKSLARERGRKDFKAHQFLNPYSVPLLRKRWLEGFSEAAKAHRAAKAQRFEVRP